MFRVGRPRWLPALLVAIVACAVPAAAWAAPSPAPGVDPTYGEGGISRLDAQVPAGYHRWRDSVGTALAAPRGAVLVVSDLTTCPEPARASDCDLPAVRRIGPGGRLDPSYGEGGIVKLDPSGPFGQLPRTGVDPRGRLLAAAAKDGTLRVRRYTAKGRIDRRFGHAGLAVVKGVDPSGRVDALLPAPHGRLIVAVAGAAESEFVRRAVRVTLVRLLPDGRRDRSYGRRGKAVSGIESSFGASFYAGRGGATLVVAHNCCSSDSFTPVQRVSAAGRLDVRFDREERRAQVKALATFPETSIKSVVARPDGTIELLGSSRGWVTGTGFALRLTAAGRADARFGSHGLVRLGPGLVSAVGGVGGATPALFQTYPDGRPARLHVERLLADGRPDRRFGGAAGLTLPEPGEGELLAAGRGRALVFGNGARNCEVRCEPDPYLIRLLEPPARGGARRAGGHR